MATILRRHWEHRKQHDMSDPVLTPLGTSPAWYNPGEAASGYLLECEGQRLLLDCGTGVISRYLALRSGTDGRALPIHDIVLTHAHLDHTGDLVPLKYGIDVGPLSDWKPRLWVPPGLHERLQRMTSAWDAPADFFSATFDVREFRPGTQFSQGPWSIVAHAVPHYIDCCALRVEAGSRSIVYSADLGPDPTFSDFARGVDVMLCEATLADGHGEPDATRGHITGAEAGAFAAAAGAGSLILTHVPVEIDREAAVAAARSRFDGPVALAVSGESWALGRQLARAV